MPLKRVWAPLIALNLASDVAFKGSVSKILTVDIYAT